jgi:hypothetical protein
MENGVLWSPKFMVKSGYNKRLNDRLAKNYQILLFTGSCQKYLQDWILEEHFEARINPDFRFKSGSNSGYNFCNKSGLKAIPQESNLASRFDKTRLIVGSGKFLQDGRLGMI